MRSILVAGLAFILMSKTVTAQTCTLPDLPEPIANNAVASLALDSETYLFSFMGLKAGKSREDITSDAYMLKLGNDAWQKIDPVPGADGRLASTAAVAAGKVWIFGGYTVADDHSEVSTPAVYSFDPVTKSYERKADMIIPVDDTVSFTYKDRYIYLVSGWHDVGNVSLIHVYDTATDTWAQATDFAGIRVFGHAGGINGNQFVISDGVAVTGIKDGKRQFGVVAQGWLGEIDESDPTVIQWSKLPKLPGDPLYRMAAIGTDDGRIVFAGGSATAYNYNGTGYDGTSAEPSNHVFAWDLEEGAWQVLPDKAVSTMDHRGLVKAYGAYYTVGGMTAEQTVTAGVHLAYGSSDCSP